MCERRCGSDRLGDSGSCSCSWNESRRASGWWIVVIGLLSSLLLLTVGLILGALLALIVLINLPLFIALSIVWLVLLFIAVLVWRLRGNCCC